MKYPIKAFLVYLVAMAIAAVVFQTTEIVLLPLHISFLGLFMYGSSTLVHHMTMKSSRKEPKRFPSYFMAITGIKMLVYLIAIAIYVLLFKDIAVPMLIAFLGLYFVYMLLEVTSIVSDLKKEE